MSTIQEILAAHNGDVDAIDTDNLTLEQIKELALQQAGQTVAEEEPEQQPRNDKGQFTKTETVEDSDDAVDDGPKGPFRREIDLGDGAGKEVFEAASMEELLDKIVAAKGNATKKIREQQARLKELEEQKKAADQNDKDDEFILSNEMLQRPTEAVRKAFKKATGIDITEVKTLADRVKALTEVQAAQSEQTAQNEAATAFIAAHPEYVPSQANGKRLTRAVNLLVAEAKQSGQKVDYATLLTRAYEDLTADGLLALKSDDADASAETQATTGAAKGRIGQVSEEVAQPQRQVRRSSSLMSRARASVAPKTEPSEDDLYSMPLDKLKALANSLR